MDKGTLYLVPNILGDPSIEKVLPKYNADVLKSIKHFIVEDEKSAKALLKKSEYPIRFEEAEFFLLNEHTPKNDIPSFINPLKEGFNMALISEAGCPVIADPGSDVIMMAHKQKIKVVPLTGPSSILLALMASGFNGQSFCFYGYLPYEKADRAKMIREMEKETSRTHLFIEAPYRNRQLLEEIVKTCSPGTMLSIACNLTTDSEEVITATVKEWLSITMEIHKKPCIFSIGRTRS